MHFWRTSIVFLGCLLFSISAFAASVVMTPATLDFGTNIFGGPGETKPLRITNTGTTNVGLFNCRAEVPFTSDLVGSVSISAGQFKTANIRLPGSTAPGTYFVSYRCTLANAPVSAILKAVVLDLAVVNPTSLNFGNVATGGSKVLNLNIKANTSVKVSFNVITAAGDRVARIPFEVIPSSVSIDAGKDVNLQVKMNGGSLGTKTGTLEVQVLRLQTLTGVVARKYTVSLTGNVVP
jgi:hypothetical protein